MHGEAGLTGGSTEMCSTRKFLGGRSAILRPLTEEARNFLRLLRSYQTTATPFGPMEEDDLLDALHRCSRVHIKLLREAAAGQGGLNYHFPNASGLIRTLIRLTN